MSDTTPKVGILLPTRGVLLLDHVPIDAGLMLSMAEQAEEAGCDSVWVGDSLLAKPRLDPLITLAAVASRTSRIMLGTSVLLASMRQPILMARDVATLDVISNGRMILAAGVGGVFTEAQRQEWLAVGVDPGERTSRLEELVQILKGLWTQPHFTFHGRHFDFANVTLEPRPVQPGGVPILLACHFQTGTHAQYRRAAQYADGFISITDTPVEFAQVVQKVTACANTEGRDPTSMNAVFYMTININTNETRAQEEAKSFIMKYYGMDYWRQRWGPYGRPETVVQHVKEYFNAGARHVILRFASFDPMAQFELFRNEVLPALRQ